MKPEFKIEGREASPAEYAQLMAALLASQAATPTARACATDDHPSSASLLDVLFSSTAPVVGETKEGEEPVYLRVSGFLETGQSTSPPSAARPKTAPDRFE